MSEAKPGFIYVGVSVNGTTRLGVSGDPAKLLQKAQRGERYTLHSTFLIPDMDFYRPRLIAWLEVNGIPHPKGSNSYEISVETAIALIDSLLIRFPVVPDSPIEGAMSGDEAVRMMITKGQYKKRDIIDCVMAKFAGTVCEDSIKTTIGDEYKRYRRYPDKVAYTGEDHVIRYRSATPEEVEAYFQEGIKKRLSNRASKLRMKSARNDINGLMRSVN